jgi:hypothetical protein
MLRSERYARFVDAIMVALAVSLPWSTSATGVLIGLWLIVMIPTLDFAALRRTLATPAGGIPVLLWVLALIGMLWAFDVSWAERWAGLKVFRYGGFGLPDFPLSRPLPIVFPIPVDPGLWRRRHDRRTARRPPVAERQFDVHPIRS